MIPINATTRESIIGTIIRDTAGATIIITTIAISTISTTTIRKPIAWTTIGGSASASSNIITTTITTFTITITIAIINLKIITTSVINETTNDTGAGVSEFKIRWIRAYADGATPIKIIQVNNTYPIAIELAEWIGFNKYSDNFWLSLMTGKIK